MLKILKYENVKRFFVFLLCFSFLGLSKISTTKANAIVSQPVKIITVGSAVLVHDYGSSADWSITNAHMANTGDTYDLTTNNVYIKDATNGAFYEGYACVDGESVGYTGRTTSNVYLYSFATSGTIWTRGFIIRNLASGTHTIQIKYTRLGTTTMYTDTIYVNVP
ncbi:hypothetical protein [Clostridium oryzae]|uniref:Uncharacterized protein n=1 Tax=Clostridium oryzae TaxID=1450648 RepID=A0A1V4ITZ9_9CLOT|nr:hypothetical protein [Clostridium oryzae]OPJ63389.1 hypothetical protein CLORY_11710 [Clostridium oryzae]